MKKRSPPQQMAREFRRTRSGAFRFFPSKAWFAQENSQPNIVQVATNILVTMNWWQGLGAPIPGCYEGNFNTGQVVFRPNVRKLPANADGVKKVGDEVGISISSPCQTFAKRNGHIRLFLRHVVDLSFLVLSWNWRVSRHREAGLNILIFSTCTNIRLTPD